MAALIIIRLDDTTKLQEHLKNIRSTGLNQLTVEEVHETMYYIVDTIMDASDVAMFDDTVDD